MQRVQQRVSLAFELVYASKRWLAGVLKDTWSPAPSFFSSTVRALSLDQYLSRPSDAPKGRAASFEYSLKELKRCVDSSSDEWRPLSRLQEKLKNPRNEKERQLAFLFEYYLKLDQMLEDSAYCYSDHPQLKIIEAMRAHCSGNRDMAAAIGFAPALLENILDRRERSYNQGNPRSLKIRTAPRLHSQSPQKKRLEPETKTVTEQSRRQRYKTACEDYRIRLLSSLEQEIENVYQENPQHLLFTLLRPRTGKSPQKIADALCRLYYQEELPGSPLISEVAPASRSQALQIDLAIHEPQPHEPLPQTFSITWKKYKIIRSLEKARSTAEFHTLLKGDARSFDFYARHKDDKTKNKEVLTQRRDSALVLFAKACGLFVASILGLPFFLVGGACIGYHYLFGSGATHGHAFLRETAPEDQKSEVTPAQHRKLFS